MAMGCILWAQVVATVALLRSDCESQCLVTGPGTTDSNVLLAMV